ncbi:MAG: DUF4450 domain-containing protein [Mediterranea massiliensis]|nr:DUF4450 domain-containing protein [Mediterranea massiliensis]
MKRRLLSVLFFGVATISAWSQYATVRNAAGDLIESTSYNDHKRGTARRLQYLPDGDAFLCVNGENRYTRALYGGPTAWRIETSDRPIFATFVKNNCRNIRFRLRLPDGRTTSLEETTYCESRYIPGRRDYKLTDVAWGEECRMEISLLLSMNEETAIWQFSGNLPKGSVLQALLAPIRNPKLSRNGDMGADAPRSFDAADGEVLQTLEIAWTNEPVFMKVADNQLHQAGTLAEFNEYETARKELAARIQFTTPDPYLNTIGAALAVAADGVWGTEEVWLHGAVGWRMPLSGWRAGYIGDALGWHDRARKHFDNYAASQVTDVPNTIPHPAQDTALALARSVKQWGTPHYSNGYICRNPRRPNQMHHYDMNLCYIDELLWHLQWTGDLDYARTVWPVIRLHLQWEKRNFDPDDDGLYDAYACIWASDALYYNSGAVTHSSAYNYRANSLAALIARKIGEDPTPYQAEADKILAALNSRLWMPEAGHWAEYQDFMGHRRLHRSAAAWTIYHAIDSEVGDAFQNYLATRYVDHHLPHIPISVSDEANPVAASAINAESLSTIATTPWMPYSWSINNVAFAEVMHTALAYFLAGRSEEGFRLMKASVLDGMYLGESPGNFGQVSFYDAARGECYRDFGDPIGVASRLFIQGLYGIRPDALNGRLLVAPGFPKAWDKASLHTPDIDFDFANYVDNARFSRYTLTHRLPAVGEVELRVPARYSRIVEVTVNGKKRPWRILEESVDSPILSIRLAAADGQQQQVVIQWAGENLLEQVTQETPIRQLKKMGNTYFAQVTQGDLLWWKEVAMQNTTSSESPLPLRKPFAEVDSRSQTPVKIDGLFNANVTDLFRNSYLTPRSPYTTLQLPLQGIGEWCHPLMTADIDDTGLREKAAKDKGVLHTEWGITFRTPAEGANIAYTSLWDNYPDSLVVPLKGRGRSLYLLMAGSTNHMQCHIDNGRIRAYYTDGSYSELPLINPYTWAPIEQLYFEDGLAFHRGRQVPGSSPLPLDYGSAPLYRLSLKSALPVSADSLGTGINRMVDGGAATLLELPLNPDKRLSHLVLETLSNDVVIGLMGVTVQK